MSDCWFFKNNCPNITWLHDFGFSVMTWDIKKTIHIYHFADKLGGSLFPDYGQCCPISADFSCITKGFSTSIVWQPKFWFAQMPRSPETWCSYFQLDATFPTQILKAFFTSLMIFYKYLPCALSICIQALGAYSSQFCTSKNTAHVVHATKL